MGHLLESIVRYYIALSARSSSDRRWFIRTGQDYTDCPAVVVQSPQWTSCMERRQHHNKCTYTILCRISSFFSLGTCLACRWSLSHVSPVPRFDECTYTIVCRRVASLHGPHGATQVRPFSACRPSHRTERWALVP